MMKQRQDEGFKGAAPRVVQGKNKFKDPYATSPQRESEYYP
jgi:hypothetical protein